MRRDLECRLIKAEILVPEVSWVDQQAARHRQSLRICVKGHQLIRERFRLTGIDPELAVALRRGEQAAAELAAIPDTPELKAADEAILCLENSNGEDRAPEVRAKIVRMAEQYRAGEHRLDLANASPAELFAFCVAVEMDAWK